MARLRELSSRRGWELFLVLLILLAAAWAASLSPFYLDLGQILLSSRFFVIPGLMALGLTVIVIHGEIDISLASMLAVCTVTLAKLSGAGAPFALAVVVVLLVGLVLGTVNGMLVAKAGLPSLAVTLGALGAYRGLAYIIGGEAGYSGFSEGYGAVGSARLWLIPYSLLLFIAVAVAFSALMNFTAYGRYSYALGANVEATRMAGVPTTRTKIVGYALGGATAALGALVWVGQYGSARADNADGSILFIVTAVVLGGVALEGGRGTILGVVLSLLLLGTLSNGMGLANIAASQQTLVLGSVLIASLALPRVINKVTARVRARRRGAGEDRSTAAESRASESRSSEQGESKVR